jgi:NitT/TauT family transport system substrate-binding protein
MAHFILSKLTGLAIAAGLAIGASSSAAPAQTKIVVRTDFKFNGYVSPLALAIDQGIYKEAGFDVSIEQGQGSSTTVQTVATGVDNFGLADSATAVLGISAQNIPVKLVAVYNQTGTMGLIYHPDSAFNGDLAALKGRSSFRARAQPTRSCSSRRSPPPA